MYIYIKKNYIILFYCFWIKYNILSTLSQHIKLHCAETNFDLANNTSISGGESETTFGSYWFSLK